MTSYSQYGEDLRILDILGERTGKLLEIGAWDPFALSNSRLLIERGWEATLVDFSPGPVRRLLAEYGSSQRVRVVQAALTPVDGGLREFQVTDDGLSTADVASYEKWKETGGFLGSLWVPLVPIHQFFIQFGGGYDFVSVDAEGLSVELAIALVRDADQRPKVMCVEHDSRIVELMQALQPFGYVNRWLNGTNIILSR